MCDEIIQKIFVVHIQFGTVEAYTDIFHKFLFSVCTALGPVDCGFINFVICREKSLNERYFGSVSTFCNSKETWFI